MRGEIRVGVAHQFITLSHQPVHVLFRNAENLAQHAHWQFTGDGFHSVKFEGLKGVVEDQIAEVCDLLFKLNDNRPRECLVEQHAGARVIRWIGFLKGAARQIFLIGLVFHANAARGAQKFRIAVEIPDVLVAGDRPETFTIGIIAPGHRVFAAQAGKGIVGRTIDETVMTGQIGMAVIGWHPNCHFFPALFFRAKIAHVKYLGN